MRDRTNISDALENHEENKNKDLSSTICEFVSLECTPQVRYIKCTDEVSEIEATFLGTSEYKGERFEKERILDGRTYLRPTERFQYTPFNSCHPGRGGGSYDVLYGEAPLES